MQPHKRNQSTGGLLLISSLCTALILPSCAFKNFSNRAETEETAANAESLEDALAILDRAIEETAPASEVAGIHLDVPVKPQGMDDAPGTPEVFQVSDSWTDPKSLDTLFEIEEEGSSQPLDRSSFELAGEQAFSASLTGGESAGASGLKQPVADALEVLEAPTPTSGLDAHSGRPALDDSAVAESETAPAALAPEPRERIVVKRPAPNYRTSTRTTEAIDEFRIVRTTAYSHTEADHIKYGELSAMGKPLRFGMVRSAAADWSRYPVGTRFRIVGKPYEYVIDDYGSALVGTDTIDLYKPSGDRMDDWGAKEVEIEVIAWGCFDKSMEILGPRKEFGEHVGRMIDSIQKQNRPGSDVSGGQEAIAGDSTGASIRPH